MPKPLSKTSWFHVENPCEGTELQKSDFSHQSCDQHHTESELQLRANLFFPGSLLLLRVPQCSSVVLDYIIPHIKCFLFPQFSVFSCFHFSPFLHFFSYFLIPTLLLFLILSLLIFLVSITSIPSFIIP